MKFVVDVPLDEGARRTKGVRAGIEPARKSVIDRDPSPEGLGYRQTSATRTKAKIKPARAARLT